jgi:hypothetical protein
VLDDLISQKEIKKGKKKNGGKCSYPSYFEKP